MSGLATLVPPPMSWVARPSEYELLMRDADVPPPRFIDHIAVSLASEDIELTSWRAPALHVYAAPGVALAVDCPLARDELEDMRALYTDTVWNLGALPDLVGDRLALVRGDESPACSEQALELHLERRQDAWELPLQGSRPRPTPRGDAAIGGFATAHDAWAGCPRGLDLPMPDGNELMLLPPEAAGLLASAPLPLDALQAAVQGWHAERMPLTLRIKVDPKSADDRYAHCWSYLDADGRPTTTPPEEGQRGPWFRLTVVRTASVQVGIETGLVLKAPAAIENVVTFYDHVVPFDNVPSHIDLDHAEQQGRSRSDVLQPLQSTLQRLTAIAASAAAAVHDDPRLLADGLLTVAGFVPHPIAEVATSAYDLYTLYAYATTGRDPLGRTMTRTEAMLTFGGLLLPVSGAALRSVARGVLPRVLRPGGTAATRLLALVDDAALCSESTAGALMFAYGFGLLTPPPAAPKP